MTMDEVKAALCKGEHSSLTISWNDDNGPNYTTVREVLDRDAAQDDDYRYYREDSFVGGVNDMAVCAETNSVWTAHYYPQTPVGFCVLHASTFEKLFDGLVALAQAEHTDGHARP